MIGGRLQLPRPQSIRARYTLTVALLSLIALSVVGAVLGLMIRNSVQARVFQETQHAAVDWLTTAIGGSTAGTKPLWPRHSSDLLQLMDSHGRVVAASTSAIGRPPLSSAPPATAEHVQNRTECDTGHDGCVMFTAVRVNRLFGRDEPHYIYAARPEPAILAGSRLELIIGGAVLGTAALAASATWWGVGRTLRPVAAIRARTAEITANDLSLRVPEPRRDDEIAQLARASNRTFARLEEAVGHQRQFAHVVSHELRSPVAGLRARLEEALMYPGKVDPHEVIRTALTTTDRLQAIMDDVLAYTRVKSQPATPEPIDLVALVREEAKARAYGRPVRVHAEGELTVLGNRMQLIGVVTNLLVNAQRHAETAVEVSVERQGREAAVIVSDDGCGIAPEDRERVFEPFLRLAEGRRRDPGGSGLGLAICRAIVRAHHGTLRIEESARGARFAVRLPLLDPARPPTAVSRPHIPVQ